MSVKSKAEELKEALQNSESYKSLIEAEKEVEADEEAKEILEEYQTIQQQIRMARGQGGQVSEETKQEFNSIKGKMKGNTKINRYMQAQQDFNQKMQQVNQIISSTLGLQSDGCGSGCEPGSGCC